MTKFQNKLLILTGALLVAALSAAIFAHKPMTAEEALILKNVEAIAQNEGYAPKYRVSISDSSSNCIVSVGGDYRIGWNPVCHQGGDEICVDCVVP